MELNTLPIRWIDFDDPGEAQARAWWAQVPAVKQLLGSQLELGPATVLVGDNGAGKSTIVEAIAATYGLNPEGGTHNAMHETQRSESPLHEYMRLARGAGASRKGAFLRAETMHGHFAYLDSIKSPGQLNFQSHGESFMEFMSTRSGMSGLWVFDEPESALSFSNCLVLIAYMNDLGRVC